jgi:hypothetical protein
MQLNDVATILIDIAENLEPIMPMASTKSRSDKALRCADGIIPKLKTSSNMVLRSTII